MANAPQYRRLRFVSFPRRRVWPFVVDVRALSSFRVHVNISTIKRIHAIASFVLFYFCTTSAVERLYLLNTEEEKKIRCLRVNRNECRRMWQGEGGNCFKNSTRKTRSVRANVKGFFCYHLTDHRLRRFFYVPASKPPRRICELVNGFVSITTYIYI